MGERIRKINEQIQRELGGFLAHERSSNKVFVTVTAVETTSDLRLATVWCSVIGLKAEEATKLLESERHDAQKYINSRLTMKYIPKLELRLDHGGEYAAHISEVIRGAL